jgi:hypothetical protein
LEAAVFVPSEEDVEVGKAHSRRMGERRGGLLADGGGGRSR